MIHGINAKRLIELPAGNVYPCRIYCNRIGHAVYYRSGLPDQISIFVPTLHLPITMARKFYMSAAADIKAFIRIRHNAVRGIRVRVIGNRVICFLR